MPDLYIDWEQYHQCIEQLAIKIHRSFWQFDQIVCLAKGGLRIGDTLSRIYQKPLAILFAASYGGSDNRTQQQLKFSQHLAMLEDNLGKHILLVDDLADSGITLSSSVNWLKERSNIQEIRTAVLWYKSCSLVIPDYYVDYLPNNPWIHQPFEHYEKFSILLDK
jgi:uncharacterized protein